ncbi:hypothetical protein AV530_004514 [Patagioenas fasciata monilis]|uniref:Uncharacterized protein n=1 Tax=Patagioenas fasciata monilis TaxID=372326 RepID=A0A1V4J5W7_PATFA|nr:hypothetical protein AV530_004514 [Patagioenas fasciata monilis]
MSVSERREVPELLHAEALNLQLHPQMKRRVTGSWKLAPPSRSRKKHGDGHAQQGPLFPPFLSQVSQAEEHNHQIPVHI